MLDKLFLTFVICAAILGGAVLFFQNNKGLLPGQQSPWSSVSFADPADETSLVFTIVNNSSEEKSYTYTVLAEKGGQKETNTLSVAGGEKHVVTPQYHPTSADGRITIEVKDDLTTQKIYR